MAAIFNTEEGVKLRLMYSENGSEYTRNFSLPGEIPARIDDNSMFSETNAIIYPNPNNGSFFLKLETQEGEVSTIDLFSSNGKLINTYKSSENSIKIENMKLRDGLYFINTRSGNRFSSSSMIIKK